MNDDSGVKSELNSFKALIEKQSNLTEAITLKHVLENDERTVTILKNQYMAAEQLNRMETGINDLVADMSDKKREKIMSERVEKIAKILSVPQDSFQIAKTTLQNLRKDLVRGSSRWLLDIDHYKDWIATTDSISLLLLSGNPHTGKSSLVAFIDDDLRTRNLSNLAVAYHAFTARDLKSPKDKKKYDVTSALKSMALQLANQNKAYAKEMEGLKESDLKLPDTLKESPEKYLWNKLKFSKYSESQEVHNIILMFDGLDQLPDNDASRFLDLLIEESGSYLKSDHFQLRVLVTVTDQPESTNLKVIQIDQHNEGDIKLYIEHELEEDEVFQGQHAEMLDLHESIRDKLPKVAGGSFSIVDQKLTRIKDAVESDAYSDDITTIIDEDPSEDPDKMAQNVIKNLNMTLNAHDIKQLNELLDWAIFGYQYFSIEELKAALFLHSGRSPLQPFEKKLKNKFSGVFDLEDDIVRVQDTIENLFRDPENSIRKKVAVFDINSAKIDMTITINQADLPSVQRFFWDLTEKVGIGKFNFSPESSPSEIKGVIQCDEHNAHYHMTEQLLKLLNDEPHEKTKALVEYALTNLPVHLERVKSSLDKESPQFGAPIRKSIAKRLVDLLSDVEGVEKFWDIVPDMYMYWASPDKLKIIEDWLTDEKTIAQLEPKERRWIKQYIGNPEEKGRIYRPITLMVAKRWLQDRDWNAHDAYAWIDSYINLVS